MNKSPLEQIAENKAMSGYYSCCGRSKLRGHWEGCERAAALRALAKEKGE